MILGGFTTRERRTAGWNKAAIDSLTSSMSTTFRLNADELKPSFIEDIKALFAHKNIAVTVYEEDETDYLSSTRANREHLDSVIADVRAGKNMVDVDSSIFE